MHTGEQGGDDVLADTAPVVGTGAVGIFNAIRSQRHGDPVGFVLATLDPGGEGVAALLGFENST